MNWSDQGMSFILAFIVSAVATALSMLVGVGLLHVTWPTLLETAAVFTSFGSTFLFVIQKRQAYLWGHVTTALYAWLFWEYKLPGSAIVQLYLLGALIYGYFRWGSDSDTRPVTLVKPLWWWGVYAVASGATWFGATTISASFGNPVPAFDSFILASSILAQWLLDNKKLENWGVWVLVNIIAIPVYWSQGLSLVSAQYVLFLLNAFWGLYMWRKSMKRGQSTVTTERQYGFGAGENL